MSAQQHIDRLWPYLRSEANVSCGEDGMAMAPIRAMTPGMAANAWFFSHPKWGPKYFDCENHRNLIGERWRTATGSWDGKVVVDMGCGPGNVFCAVNGSPKTLIGVDISHKALAHAAKKGYTPLLADLHDTPLISGFADLVTANAVLHHVDDMAAVLAEAARLVRPGGMLVTDEDPMQCAHKLTGLGRAASIMRPLVPICRVRNHPSRRLKFTSWREQRHRNQTEIHNRFLGDGVNRRMFFDVLEPLGFSVKLYPHAHLAGSEIFQGGRGSNTSLLRMSQRSSGIDPAESDLLLSVMCIAVRDRLPTRQD